MNSVPLVNRSGENVGEGEVVYHAEGGRCILRLRKGVTEFAAEGLDYFEALCAVEIGGRRYFGGNLRWKS